METFDMIEYLKKCWDNNVKQGYEIDDALYGMVDDVKVEITVSLIIDYMYRYGEISNDKYATFAGLDTSDPEAVENDTYTEPYFFTFEQIEIIN